MAVRYVAEPKRAERAQRLFEEQGDLIRVLRPGFFEVPSQSEADENHYVDARRQFCSCWDWQRQNGERSAETTEPVQGCKHVIAVGIFRRNTGLCVSCAQRFYRSKLREVAEEGEFKEGELLCRPCAKATMSEVY